MIKFYIQKERQAMLAVLCYGGSKPPPYFVILFPLQTV